MLSGGCGGIPRHFSQQKVLTTANNSWIEWIRFLLCCRAQKNYLLVPYQGELLAYIMKRNELFMKKIVPYCVVSFIFLLLSIALSMLFQFSLTNTWQALVSLLLIVSPLWVFGWKQTCEHKDKHPFLCFGGKYCLILFAVGYLVTVIIYVEGLI